LRRRPRVVIPGRGRDYVAPRNDDVETASRTDLAKAQSAVVVYTLVSAIAIEFRVDPAQVRVS